MAISLEPQAWFYQRVLAEIQQARGADELAIDAYSKALALAKANRVEAARIIEVLEARAGLYRAKGATREAERELAERARLQAALDAGSAAAPPRQEAPARQKR